MSYSITNARTEFEEWCSEAFRLVRKAERKKYSAGSGVSDYLLCAALFLTHARFENYLQEIIRWFVLELNSRRLSCDRLPGAIREMHMLARFPHSSFKNYYILGDEKQLITSLKKTLNQSDWSWAQDDYVGAVDARAIVGNIGYPSRDNFRRLFERLGIDIEAELGSRLRANPFDILADVGGVRTEMAHVGMPPHITAQDIHKKVEKISALVKGIDRTLSKHLSSIK